MKMTDQRNRTVYRLWAPVYDAILGNMFAAGRQRANQLLNAQPHEQVLLVGAGTGADLPLLPKGVRAVGIDLSPDMLARAYARRGTLAAQATFTIANAQVLPFANDSFDAAILNLILSVVPDATVCLHETLRVLKPTGRIVIFDKLLAEHGQITAGKRLLNLVTTLLGTDVTRRFSQIIENAACTVECDEPSILGGMYRVIMLRSVKA